MIENRYGNDSDVEMLSKKFQADYAFLLSEQNRKAKKEAPMQLLAGIVLLLGSAAYGLFSYFFMDGEHFIVLEGSIIAGLIFTFRAIMNR